MAKDLYDIALSVTNEIFGDGTFERLHHNNPDPGIQAAITRATSGGEWIEDGWARLNSP